MYKWLQCQYPKNAAHIIVTVRRRPKGVERVLYDVERDLLAIAKFLVKIDLTVYIVLLMSP